uniref:L-serine ammonia-lyase, iron-sulfur-dependent, subunit alpha n=1 Tax=Ndongobacter massiliensis TaxID=1871025 RepID=UPI0009314AE1|nr:L-serine ammonia-lyase, iron-sulfur-dependent, subunit alpha [Ndongobacter massiliensis]
MLYSGKELLAACQRHNCAIWECVLAEEPQKQEQSQDEFLADLQKIYDVMKSAALRGKDEELTSVSGLLHGNATRLFRHSDAGRLLSPETLRAMSMAISTSEVNASMGKIVASPTAGAAGILPACLVSWQQRTGCDDNEVLHGMMTAAQIGAIVMARANVSGAEGGCQAECGSAAAMAAAALTELMGGTPEQALNAAGYALIHVMGLVCDPIGGRVEYPCFLRNASGVLNAMGAAELALAGIQNFADFDGVVQAMKEVGDSLPAPLRETGLGGIAKHCHAAFREKNKEQLPLIRE